MSKIGDKWRARSRHVPWVELLVMLVAIPVLFYLGLCAETWRAERWAAVLGRHGIKITEGGK